MNSGKASSVAITRCSVYDQATVTAAVREAVEYLGGMAAVISHGESVFLKNQPSWGPSDRGGG